MWLEKDDEQQNQNKQDNTNNNTSIGSGGGSATPTQGSNTEQGNPSTITSNSSQPTQQFGTVQDYLGANKQQGEDLGQKLTSSLSDTQNQEKGSIDQAAQNTNNQITDNTINYDGSLVNKAKTDPNAVASNSNDLNSFLKQWNASYAGPSSFESSDQYSQAAQAANDANTKQQELSTTGGREQLIGDQFGVYGQGNKGLDQAVLQSSSYFPQVQQQEQGFKSIQDYLGNTANTVNDAALSAKATTDATKAATQGQFTNSLTDFQNNLNNQVGSSRDAATQSVEQYQKDFASGDMNKVQQDLTASGVDPATSQNIISYLTNLNKDYGISPTIQGSLIGNPNTDITAANTASAQDYAKAAALQKLTGVDYSGVLNPADAAKASTGTFAQQSLKSPDLSNYLKTSLNTQDNSLLSSSPAIKWDDIVSGKVNSQQAQDFIQKIADAGTRQGVDPKSNSALTSANASALQGLRAIVMGLPANPPQNTLDAQKTYADAAVKASMLLGQSEQDAKAQINTWIQDLRRQERRPAINPIY